MTNLENAVICLDNFLSHEKAKPGVCSECSEKSANAVDFTEAEKALNFICKQSRLDNKAFNDLLGN
jgi:hypothetical protein